MPAPAGRRIRGTEMSETANTPFSIEYFEEVGPGEHPYTTIGWLWVDATPRLPPDVREAAVRYAFSKPSGHGSLCDLVKDD